MNIIIILLVCISCAVFASDTTGGNTTETEDQQTQEQKFVEEWAKLFFSMARVPRKGQQMLIFPGLYDNNSSPRESRSSHHSNSKTMPVAAPLTSAVSDEPIVVTSSDSRLLVNQTEPYCFEEVEALDEDQRQKRKIRSARRQVDLLEANEAHLTTMINSVLSSSRDYLTNNTVRASVVRYLTQKMRSFGLVTGHQVFDPQEFSELFDGHSINGTNVIGILPGELWGTKEDRILVIGAHWDTVANSDGMDDNGSGVAAVLEVARAMTESSCRPRHSVIFVAFDLEEVGCLGSIFFVRDFLIPQVLLAHGGAQLQGAFILDTIMNYNDTQFSQTLSPEWSNALPHFWSDIKAENQTGDFLAVLYRKDVDSNLANTIAKHWKGETDDEHHKQPLRKHPKHLSADSREINSLVNDRAVETVRANKSKFRLKKVRMELEAEVGEQLERLAPWLDLLRSDHSRFWYHNVEGYPKSLPAVIITDTAPYRGVMQECYHQSCDSSSANEHLKFANIQFLTKTCQALIDSMVTLSESKCLSPRNNDLSSITANPWIASRAAELISPLSSIAVTLIIIVLLTLK